MPTITPFGEVTLGDPISIDRWMQAHAAKHQQYVVENIFAGQFSHLGTYVVKGSTGGILTGTIDGDWMLRHAARHISLATAAQKMPGNQLPPLSSADTKVLLLNDTWQTDQELQDWHALHNRLHFLIDQVRQVATVQAKPSVNKMPGRPANWFPARSHP